MTSRYVFIDVRCYDLVGKSSHIAVLRLCSKVLRRVAFQLSENSKRGILVDRSAGSCLTVDRENFRQETPNLYVSKQSASKERKDDHLLLPSISLPSPFPSKRPKAAFGLPDVISLERIY